MSKQKPVKARPNAAPVVGFAACLYIGGSLYNFYREQKRENNRQVAVKDKEVEIMKYENLLKRSGKEKNTPTEKIGKDDTEDPAKNSD